MTPHVAAVAVVPVRGLANSKSRLAGVLDAEAREAVTRRMLRTVIHAALGSGAVAGVAVISPDPAALALARQIDPRVIAIEQGSAPPGLNAAVTAGRDWAIGRGATRLLVLFGDLPLLTAIDVRALAGERAPVVLAADRHGRGTNAMAIGIDEAEVCAFRFGFGPDSLAYHRAEAERLGLAVTSFNALGTAHDLDTPADLAIALDAGADVSVSDVPSGRETEPVCVGDRR